MTMYSWLGRCSGLMLLGSIACSSPDLNGPPSTDVSQLYWTLTLSAHAITMDTLPPYDTLQLTAIARNSAGTPLTGVPAPTFVTTDSSVRVSPTGLLTARAARSNVQVIASLTYQGIRLVDTAVINVTASAATPPTFHHLAFGLMTGDTATIAAPRLFSGIYFPSSKTLQAEAQDVTGTSIPNALVALRVSDALQATVDATTSTGTADVFINMSTSRRGPVTVYGSATVYGVTMQDSVQLTVTNPLWALFSVTTQIPPGSQTSVFNILPAATTIGVGGVIWWVNGTTDSLDIVFDDPTAASADLSFLDTGGGDIAAWVGDPANLSFNDFRARQFLRAGTFPFHSVRTGVAGTITVQ